MRLPHPDYTGKENRGICSMLTTSIYACIPVKPCSIGTVINSSGVSPVGKLLDEIEMKKTAAWENILMVTG